VHLCQRRESSYIGVEERREGMNLDAADRLASATARPGEASESARAWHAFSFYQLHKWSTVGPPFKLVKILIDFQCGIESISFILWTF
jgi:hypothetical protein